MKRKKSAFKESLLSVPYSKASRANWCYTRSNRDVIMFDVDVTTCVALFLTNILHLKPYVQKIPVTKLPNKPCFATCLFYSTVKI